MRKIALFFVGILFGFTSLAEEGMLIPTVLGAFESDMQAMGMKISAKDIYDMNNASIKDAIIHFNGGCTASIISDKGLLLTNHHCGFSQIYNHSTVENNIAKNGFYAKTLNDELPNNNLVAIRMVRIEDVTKKVLGETSDMSGTALQQHILATIARLKAEAIDGTHYEADIKPFDGGNSYFLLVKETFKDVRLVGTPPNFVGKFGGDTDNWMWPRHTGDFSLFRIYANRENKPADYAMDNVPYSPIYHLPISIKSRKEGDFTMIFGFPGVTEQHTISTELEYIVNKLRPDQIKMRDLSLSVINKAMAESEQTTINYASKQARIANAWKKWMGQIEGLKRVGAVNQKIEKENNYTLKAEGNALWKKEYGSIVEEMKNLSKKYNHEDYTYNMYIEYVYAGSEIFARARTFEKLMNLYNEQKTEELKQAIEEQKKGVQSFYSKYNEAVDKEVFILHSQFYKEKIDNAFLPVSLRNNEVSKLARDIYKKSFLVDGAKYENVLNNFEKFAKKKVKKDMGYKLFTELQEVFYDKLLNDLRTYFGEKNTLEGTYIKGKYEMYPEDKHWADANSTLRLSYGKLEGNISKDGIQYREHTTLEGVIEKYNSGLEEYDVFPRMLELQKAKNYGDYAQDGELWVCTLSSNHTTGGNSGSPQINGEGQLVGLNFDRTWESTMSDYQFDTEKCRNISVDIRYVLWLVDIYGEAPHLIKEMTIVK